MDANRAVNLVVQTNLVVGRVLVAGELHTIHAQIRILPAGLINLLGVDDRQRDKRPAVTGPALHLRQLADRRLSCHDRPIADVLWQHRQRVLGQSPVSPWTAHRPLRVRLHIDQLRNRTQSVAEDQTRPLNCSEQVAHHRELAVAHVGEQQRRPTCGKHPPMNRRSLEMCVDRLVDAH